ncbi:hypothetical protein Dalk_4554 [Desulfatibacillum aliphaticivorans]|uniref:Uncharacterized protein n=1 Tax=Desulfatibacillum aliphaticivorans TaxID=218208 RepID=B8FCR9_DESAL|nr:hypothetical protein [Desulfatibacillum aliphaticivorans]ACL06232.1 hypothetical protein Dalk_4554 [Desulfatibacillum aliphaticivorans]
MSMFLGEDYFKGPETDHEKGYYSKLDKNDLVSRLRPLFNMGYTINDRGVFERMTKGVAWITPWHHVKSAHNKRCNLDHHIIFDHFGFIPSRCMECWKVVVNPRTVKELFLLLEVEKGLGLASKCGIEVRDYTHALYGGYFYGNSVEEGRNIYEIVRAAVNEHISPEIPVVLKRGCTEFEMKFWPSVSWFITDENREMETYIEDRVEDPKRVLQGQPDHLLDHIHRKWIKWAFAHGDSTYKEFTNGEPLYPETVKYHEGDIDEIKRELGRVRGIVSGLSQEAAEGMQSDIQTVRAAYGASERQLGAILGFNDVSPLERRIMIGEQDETT